MVCKLISSAPIRRLRHLATLAAFGLLASAPSAFADRIVYFEALGHSEIVDSGKKLGYYNPANGNDTGPSTLHTKCTITITNSSPNDQKVSVNLTGTATGSPTSLGTDTSTTPAGSAPTYTSKDQSNANTSPLIDASGRLTNYVLQAGKQIIVTASFPPPNYLTTSSQDARCTGNILVSDNDVTLPGFVVANGMMTTWSQGTAAYQASGTGQMRAEVRYYYNPFTIGGGRAF